MFITLTRLWEEPRISLVTVMGCAPFHPTPTTTPSQAGRLSLTHRAGRRPHTHKEPVGNFISSYFPPPGAGKQVIHCGCNFSGEKPQLLRAKAPDVPGTRNTDWLLRCL